MSEEKVPSLEIEETEVKPVELPEGAKLSRKEEGEQDFGKDPNAPPETPEEDDGSHPDSGKDTGRAPRATRRRTEREQKKKEAAQRKAFSKYVQQMQKPVRHGEMHQILQHVEQNILGPKIKRLDDLVDKLQLLPDFIGNCLNDEGQFDIEPSLETFDEFYENYVKRLEAEEAAEKEKLEEEAKKKAEEEAAAKTEEDTPTTEETQKE